MTSLCYIYMVWTTVCVGSEIPVSGHVGSTVILPCELKRVDPESLHIQWLIHSEVVFERAGKESYDGEGYEGRVDVPEDELSKGNCSLVLNKLALNDSAVYTSYQIVARTKRSTVPKAISRVNLSVRPEKPKEDHLIEDSGPKDDTSRKSPHTLLILFLVSSFLYIFPVP